MKNMKKLFSVLLVVMVASMLLYGCGQSTDENAESQGTDGDTTAVQVAAIDGNTLTVTVGELNEPSQVSPSQVSDGDGNAKGGPQGADPGDKPDVSDSEKDPGDRPEGMPSEVSNSENRPEDMPEGTPGEGGRGGGPNGFFTAGQESIQITLTDATKITIASQGKETEGTAEDISQGDVLLVTLDDENQALTVSIQSMEPRGDGSGGRPGNADEQEGSDV